MVRWIIGVECRVGRIVAERFVLNEMPNNVDSKAIHTPPQPEPHHIIDGGAHLRIAPVQVGLLGQERMIIVLAGRFVVGPGAAAECRQPVVGWPPARGRIAPYVPVALVTRARRSAFDKPGMTV